MVKNILAAFDERLDNAGMDDAGDARQGERKNCHLARRCGLSGNLA
jgi:hypothetical protein